MQTQQIPTDATNAVDQQIAIIENSVEVFKSGPQILRANRERNTKAIAIGRKILADIQAHGMNAEMDERCRNYLANCNAALKQMKEGRSEVTQIMDALKKMFTEIENDLDSKKAGTVPASIQSSRDQYAKQVHEENERKRVAAELAAAKSKEAIDIKSAMELEINRAFENHLLRSKNRLRDAFNAATLETFEQVTKDIRMYVPGYTIVKHREIATAIPSFHNRFRHHTTDEINAIISPLIESTWEELAEKYRVQMINARNDINDLFDSKLAELQEMKRRDDELKAEKERQRLAEEERQRNIAAADAKKREELERQAAIDRENERIRLEEQQRENARLEEQRKQREEDERKRAQAEAEENERKAQLEIEMRKQGEQTMVMFNTEAALSETVEAPETRQGFDIVVKHPAGWVQIFQLWFENEGKKLPVDKIGSTKMDSMKTWCEKFAVKTGTKIESQFLSYETELKAVNRKSK